MISIASPPGQNLVSSYIITNHLQLSYVTWTGVPFTKIIEACSDVSSCCFRFLFSLILAGSKWRFLIQYGKDNYSTNCPRFVHALVKDITHELTNFRADVEDENCFLAYEHEGQPIPRDHGYIRIIIPQLYGWKSCKWLEKIEFVDEDQPGFWETRGYSNTANVWT